MATNKNKKATSVGGLHLKVGDCCALPYAEGMSSLLICFYAEVYMGFLKRMKTFFSGTRYRINREILKDYIEETIEFARKEELSFGDEFYLMTSEQETEKLHICIINYDANDSDCLDSEKNLTGIVIFVNDKKAYDPEHDEKYYSAEDFINLKLDNFPEEFVLLNDLGAPASLESYKI